MRPRRLLANRCTGQDGKGAVQPNRSRYHLDTRWFDVAGLPQKVAVVAAVASPISDATATDSDPADFGPPAPPDRQGSQAKRQAP